MLERYSQLLLRRRDFETAWSSYSTVAELYRLLGEAEGEAIARHQLGGSARPSGRPDRQRNASGRAWRSGSSADGQ